jgi:hypothetical protein
MSPKRRRLSKKECQRRERKRAEEEAKDRSDSHHRQQRIKELWQELKADLDRARELAKDDVGTTLFELLALQRDEINYLRPDHMLYEWAKTHARNELDALRAKLLRPLLARATKFTPKQVYEARMRSRGRRYEVGLIEYEFGGLAEAKAGFPYDPTCLDDILDGCGVIMKYLEILFGMERHRFPTGLPSVRAGRKILYSAFAVVKIMDALLSEELLEREQGARGGSQKKLWLGDPDRRKRALLGIGSRAYALSFNKQILAAFWAVCCRHLASGYPKDQLPEGFEDWLARAGRRYLD